MKNAGLVALALIQLVDSISYMVVAPSIVFYVLQVGGSVDQYGLVLSTFSFASFVGKPVLGMWLDARGNKFRVPYMVSISLACVGGFFYFIASFFTSPSVAVGMIFFGRLLNGFGAANQALGFAYLASVVSPDQMTQTSSVLSLTRIIGMATGPAFNVLLAKIAWSITIGSTTFEIDSLNSVGLFLALSNIVAFLVIWIILEEPPEKKITIPEASIDASKGHHNGVLESLCCIEILLPVFTLFVINSSFQLIETGFTPAASHALGWGPIESSGVLGSSSIVIFGCMMLVFTLSKMKVPDEGLIALGSVFWIVGGTSMYYFWKEPGVVWQFVVPVMVAIAGFPFMAPTNRSLFTKAVDSIPELESKHGTMQALLSSVSSVAGFMTPGFVASFVLRTPEEVEASKDRRELNAIALYVPILTALILVGLAYQRMKLHRIAQAADQAEAVGERTSLLNRGSRYYSEAGIKQRERLSTEIHRRSSVTIMGIPAGETYEERVERKSVAEMVSAKILEDDDELNNLDF